MTDLTPEPAWLGVRQIETTDPVAGGPDGVANQQAIALAARTEYLKQQILEPFSISKMYKIGERVRLANGDTAVSEVDDNTTNPNEDMTGWINTRGAAFIQAKDGKSQEQVNNETEAQLVQSREKLARTVWINDYGDVGNGQEASAAFQAAVNAAGVGGTVLFDGKGEYLLSVPTNILNKQEINGNGALLINNFDRTAYPRGVLQGLMQYGYNSSGAGTNIESLGATTAAINHLESVLTIASTANVNVGDMVNFGMLSAFVLDKTPTTLTLDRFATYNVPAGTAVYKVNFFSGIRIHDFEIDFNGTTELPRYGYGVIGHGAYDCHAYNFKSRNIGSKVVQYGRAIDCTAKNIPHFFGTDNAADGGHGYVVRFAGGCDSCVAENVEGILVRHTVDLAGASRCVVKNNKALKNHSASFLTHGLNTHYNQFKDNDSYDSNSAYQVVEGDTYNSFSGGKVVGRMFIGDANLDQTAEWKNLNITNSHALSQLNDFTLSNSIINCLDGQTAALFRFTDNRARVVTLNDCTININSAITNCLMSSSGTGGIKFVLNRCTINVKRIAQFVLMAANDTIEFNDCTLVATDTTENLPLISSTGKIIVNGGNFSFNGSGLVFFGVTNTSTTLSLNGVTIQNATGIWRRYQTGSKVMLGQNTLINSSYAALSNTNLGTIGVANNLAYPPAGTWEVGSRMVNPAPAAGGYAEYIMVAGGWKGASAIQA